MGLHLRESCCCPCALSAYLGYIHPMLMSNRLEYTSLCGGSVY